MRSRHTEFRFLVAIAFLFCCKAAHAVGPATTQSDKSREALVTALAFPVVTVAAATIAVLLGLRAGRSHSMMRAILGALIGLVLTAGLGLALLARTPREAAFFATSIFTLGAIPTGLIGLIVGGLASLVPHRKPKR